MTLNIVIFGLSITSSWGNGHATTYRALIKALQRRGHDVTFLERDVPWYRDHRDLPYPPYCRTELYAEFKDVAQRYAGVVETADLVILGSYVPDGIALGNWITTKAKGVTAFYDIDTPVTLAALEEDGAEYLSAELIPRFDLYLSFTGGPTLELLESLYGSPRARVLYCSADPDLHRPVEAPAQWNLGYLGTYSEDRQEALNRLLLEPARQAPRRSFAVAGSSYPAGVIWPFNVQRIEHIPPDAHPAFFGRQSFTLNITRRDMVSAGFSPSVRLFEAAASGVPVISDRWPGLETVFRPNDEILVADTPQDVIHLLSSLPEERRRSIAAAARRRFLTDHTPDRRACQLEGYYVEVLNRVSRWTVRPVLATLNRASTP